MKKVLVSIAAVAALSSSVSASNVAGVEVSANVAGTSNYIWRGMTQTNNAPAIQGGIDFGLNGFYAGIWGSNVSWTTVPANSLESDFYAGYAGEYNGLGYDIGYIKYAYPKSSVDEFEEAYIGLSYDFGVLSLAAKYSAGQDTAPDDMEISTSIPFAGNYTLDASYGDYDTVGTRYSVALGTSIGKFDVSLGYYDFSADAGAAADEDNVVLTVSTSF